jgi:adenosylcobinamide-GDP ribazoletransferase
MSEPRPRRRLDLTSVRDGWRLAFGTFTALPVAAPARVDRRSFGTAMVLAPVTALPALAGSVLLGLFVVRGSLPAWVAAVLALAGTALLSRALHLDGLADLADGLTVGHDPKRSLEVMRRGDVGPAGAAALMLVTLLDAACLATLLADAGGIALAGVALVASRLAAPVCARSGIPAARPDGLGQAVAGTVSRGAAASLVVAVAVVSAALAGLVAPQAGPSVPLLAAARAVVVVVAGLAGALAVRRRAVQRLGGVTGDVIGAAIEIGLAAALTVAVVVHGRL